MTRYACEDCGFDRELSAIEILFAPRAVTTRWLCDECKAKYEEEEMSRWTQEQRDRALSDLQFASQCDDTEPYSSGVSYNSAMVDITCQRNDLLEAMKAIRADLDADSETSYRADDSEGAMDVCHAMAKAAIAKAEAK